MFDARAKPIPIHRITRPCRIGKRTVRKKAIIISARPNTVTMLMRQKVL